MQSVLIVVHLVIVTALVVVVLLQRSEGGAIGIGGGGFMTGRAQANVLTRATSVLGALFFATSLGLTILAGWSRPPAAIFESTKDAPATGAPLTPPDTSPANLLDQLKRMEEQGAPAPETVPAAPVPPTASVAPETPAAPPAAPVEPAKSAEPAAPAAPAPAPAPAPKKPK